MNPGPVLELCTGTPRWYPAAGTAVFTAVIASLCITPLEWPWALGVLGAACLILFRSAWQLLAANRFPRIRVYSDYSLVLTTREGQDISVCSAGSVWICQWAVVLKIDWPEHPPIRVVISRDRNERQSFRRFSVLSRFQFAVAERERQNGRQAHTQGV